MKPKKSKHRSKRGALSATSGSYVSSSSADCAKEPDEDQTHFVEDSSNIREVSSQRSAHLLQGLEEDPTHRVRRQPEWIEILFQLVRNARQAEGSREASTESRHEEIR